MSKTKKKVSPSNCTLCGRRFSLSASRFVTGATGFSICEGCVSAATLIHQAQRWQERPSQQKTSQDKRKESPLGSSVVQQNTIISPQEMIEELDRSIIGQADAKKALAAAFWKQQLKAQGNAEVPRSTLLLYGPTGCGKTALVREAAKLAGVPFMAFDATAFSETGYKGKDPIEMVSDFMQTYAEHKHKAYGVIFLDELDKLAASEGNEYRAEYCRGTQYSLLKLVEGMEVRVGEELYSTAGLLFIFGGTFSRMEDVVQKRSRSSRIIGFETGETSSCEVLTPTTEDFICCGMERELMGRLTRTVKLSALTMEQLRSVVLDSTLSPYKGYQAFFKSQGIELQADNKCIDQWIEDALKLGTGARGLQTVIEQAMEPLLFRLAEGKHREKVWYV